jgi:CheY-like chemotaxis protein
MSNDSTSPARIRRTVIIADDAPGNRMLASAIIGAEDYDVVEARDGIEAWSLIQELRPSVVLLDVRMPGRNGLDILRAIKADPNLTATRVILLTASAELSDISAGLAAGADSYLTKPFSAEDLLSRLEEALEL